MFNGLALSRQRNTGTPLVTHGAARGVGRAALNSKVHSLPESPEQAGQRRHNANGDLGGVGRTVHDPAQEAVEGQAGALDIIAEMEYRLDTLSTAQKRLLFSMAQRLEILGYVHRQAEVTLITGRQSSCNGMPKRPAQAK